MFFFSNSGAPGAVGWDYRLIEIRVLWNHWNVTGEL